MTGTAGSAPAPQGEPWEWEAGALSAALACRAVSAVEVMGSVLDRIAAVNPAINAIVSLRPREELLAQARAADAAPRRGWLHGMPIAVKDLVETAGIRTTHGSPIHATHVPEVDDLIAARMKAAGAILIGKTNVPEFGLGSQSYNPVFGVTRNPYDVARTAGGSSGGAAAALAARLVPVADGSDMMGSLRNPAAFCNVYGFRPSHGLVPGDAEGDLFLHPLSTLGPMARSIGDLAGLLEVIAGPDARLPQGRIWRAAPLDAPVAGRRLGWIGDWAGYYPTEPGVVDLGAEAMAVFEGLGVAVEPVVPAFDPARLWSAWTTLRSFALAGGMAPLWRDPATAGLLKPEAVWEIERGLALSGAEVLAASAVRSDWFRCLNGLYARYDALVLPSAQVFPFDADLTWPREIAGQAMDSYHRWMEVVIPAALVGLPALAIPAGFQGGLPMGVQVIGPAGGDAALLQLGQAYHRATDWPGRVPPPLARGGFHPPYAGGQGGA